VSLFHRNVNLPVIPVSSFETYSFSF